MSAPPLSPRIVLGVDPGTRKCGIAVVEEGTPPRTLHRAVVDTAQFTEALVPLLGRYGVTTLVIGNQTGSKPLCAALAPHLPPGIEPILMVETNTSMRARIRWCEEHPPKRVWERILPGFRTPTDPVDDYAAAIIAEDWLVQNTPTPVPSPSEGRGEQ